MGHILGKGQVVTMVATMPMMAETLVSRLTGLAEALQVLLAGMGMEVAVIMEMEMVTEMEMGNPLISHTFKLRGKKRMKRNMRKMKTMMMRLTVSG